MEIKKIGSRSVIFTYNTFPEWDLNIHLILGDKYNYIIDTGVGSGSVEPVIKYINAYGKTYKNVVVNTHCHWDHVWGNHMFRKDIIVAHRKCRDELMAHWYREYEKNRKFEDGEVEKCLPNMIFDDRIYYYEDGIRIIYTPGHSEDCITVIDEKDKIINIGDNIGDDMENIVPVIETDIETYIESLKKVQEFDFHTIISGHNIPAERSILDDIIEILESKKELEEETEAEEADVLEIEEN